MASATNWRFCRIIPYLKSCVLLRVAVALRFAADRTVADARITLGAVASHPVEASEAAAQLVGRSALN
ncbi:MAG: hypothetical protein E6J11_09335 [Chloroflexi bacterium]|nr:MAG: hypothetical protein E6J11_09335 [Chloroflexota bacterium]